MTLSWLNKLGLLWNSQKSVMLDDIFDFDVYESPDGGVLYAHNMWLINLCFIYIIYFIIAIVLNLLIPTKIPNTRATKNF